MADWTLDRPAGSFTGQADTDQATVLVALTNSPAGLEDSSVTAVAIATEANAVDISPGGGDDDYGLSVRIVSGGVVLAGLTSTTYEPVTTLQISSNYPLAFTAITSFGYVLTTATKAQWDAAEIEYLQLYSKTKGGDNDFVTIAVGSSDITVTYTPGVVPTLDTPTEADITGTTATVGCNTDDNTGTLYYYISTSATPPSASELKTPTVAVDSGNIATPASTQTFAATGLTQSGTYYTYFLQTNGTGDSLILESGIWYAQSVITADDLRSASQLSTPLSGGENILLADDLRSASELSTPLSGGENTLLGDDLRSASELSTPLSGGTNILLGDDLRTASELSTPVFGGISTLLADDLRSASELSTPTSGGENTLLGDDLRSASELSTPVLLAIDVLLGDDLRSASELSTPASGGENTLLADDLRSASRLSTPVIDENVETLVPDADTSIGSWTTAGGSAVNLYQQIDENDFNDSDYIRSELNPATSASKFKLSDPITTPLSIDVQRVKYRYSKDITDSQQIDLTVRLIEGASTVRASWTHTNISITVTAANQVLTTPQKESITDHNDLFIEFEANGL